MVLWTIQTQEAWREFRSSGVLRTTADRITEESLSSPYGWIVHQMRERVGSPPSERAYPVWAWLQWENARRARPDLRAGGHLAKGERGVRIEFECRDSDVLLSDFDLWHYVLNYWYLPESVAEGDQFEAQLAERGLSFFEAKPLRNRKYHERVVASWDKILDLDWTGDELALPRPAKSIQGTTWEVNMEQVRALTFFRSR